MTRYQVQDEARCLGDCWGGFFTGITTDYSWAKQQMETRFMSYLREYKHLHPKVTMGRMSCKLTMDGGDFIEVTIVEVNSGGMCND